jgi:hypothetical protein
LRVNFLSMLIGSFAMPAENPTVAMVEAAYRHHGIQARYIDCEGTVTLPASGLRLTDFQAAATASRHVVIAAARCTRCDLADVRWRWTLNVL